MKGFRQNMLLHNHLKNISIVCFELLGLAFFDTDCEAVCPDLRLNNKEKKPKNNMLKYIMHINTSFTTLNIFLDFIILKQAVYSNFQKILTFLFLVMDLCIAVLCLNLLKSNLEQPELVTSIQKECFRNYIHGRTFKKFDLSQEADILLLAT